LFKIRLLDGLPAEEAPEVGERVGSRLVQRLPQGLHGQVAARPTHVLHVLRPGRHRGRLAHGHEDPHQRGQTIYNLPYILA